MSYRIGSLCSGYRGLDMAVEEVFGGTTAWVSDVDPGANKILAHHWPTTPNIGDLTTADWGQVLDTFGRPDIVLGGYPCQPFSLAGNLEGTDDARHLWPFIARALGVLRPRVAIFENVANHLRLGFDTVLCDLADLGFDVEWCVVRADEVGAPHQRRRLIIVARSTDSEGTGREGADALWRRAARDGAATADAPDLGHERAGSTRRRGHGPADSGVLDAHPAGDVRRLSDRNPVRPRSDEDGRTAASGAGSPTDAASLGWGEGRAEPEGQQGRPGTASRGLQDWGQFAPAIARWEAAIGRTAPWATDDHGRLNPALVEWMMGLPAGHVTDVPGMTRTQQLKALGNGVVPQQAAAAIRLLAARAIDGAVAA